MRQQTREGGVDAVSDELVELAVGEEIPSLIDVCTAIFTCFRRRSPCLIWSCLIVDYQITRYTEAYLSRRGVGYATETALLSPQSDHRPSTKVWRARMVAQSHGCGTQCRTRPLEGLE